MSNLVGTLTPFAALNGSPDRRWDERFDVMAFDRLWPRSRSLGSATIATRYESPRVLASGHRRDNQIALTAVDSSGTAMAGATIKAFRTSDDTNNSLTHDTQEGPAVTSEPDGTFIMSVPNADAHYLVAYKAGSPDVAGTTTNTLVGT